MKITSSSDSNVTSILERRKPGSNFRPVEPAPVALEPDLVLLPDMANMNARQVVQTIARALTAEAS